MASTKKRKATGDCFEAAGRHMLAKIKENLKKE
jgi:hypothetical protein